MLRGVHPAVRNLFIAACHLGWIGLSSFSPGRCLRPKRNTHTCIMDWYWSPSCVTCRF